MGFESLSAKGHLERGVWGCWGLDPASAWHQGEEGEDLGKRTWRKRGKGGDL